MGTSEPSQQGASLNEVLAELEKYEFEVNKTSVQHGEPGLDHRQEWDYRPVQEVKAHSLPSSPLGHG